MSLSAYHKTQRTVQSPRDTEYRIFGLVTHALMAVKDSGERGQALIKALDWNRRLWSVLSSDCAVEGNGLSKELRAQIISLSIFVSKFSSQVSRGEEEIDTLIDINRTIMEGLAPQAKAPDAPSASPPGASVPGISRDA